MSLSKPIADFEPTDEMCTDTNCFPKLQSKLSVYIPYVKLSVTREQIALAFYRNNVGIVKRVDLVRKEEEDRAYFQAFVHFEFWFSNIAGKNIHDKLIRGEQARMVYDDLATGTFMNHSWQRDVYQDTADEITRLRNLITTMQTNRIVLIKPQRSLITTKKSLQASSKRSKNLSQHLHKGLHRVQSGRYQ